ncbi:MAG: hypothetical protein IJD75_05860 [Clostridia bacterium]|nr:hypothetical protein [Clostridia bacterium]
MYLKNLKRKSTAIYITYTFMVGIVGYFGLFRNSFICSVLFFWWLLLAFILISRYGSRQLVKLKIKKQILIDQGKEYKLQNEKMLGLILLVALPFYYFWFLITFLTCMNGYVFIMLNLPTLTLSFLALGHIFPIWRDLEAKGWVFWGVHVGMYAFTQILGWTVRTIWLSDFYIK